MELMLTNGGMALASQTSTDNMLHVSFWEDGEIALADEIDEKQALEIINHLISVFKLGLGAV